MGSSARHVGKLDYNLSISYQWLKNRQLEENNLLGQSSLRYFDSPRRFSISVSYTISEEQRNARGLRYLEVEPGEGEFISEAGQFIPDPDGNFIQVEELLSDISRVRRGDRSFRINKDFGPLLVRFLSDVNEELLPGGNRSLFWIVPFLTDSDQPFLFYDRRFDGELRVLPWRGFHAVNFQLTEEMQLRSITGINRRRVNRNGRVTLKQAAVNSFFEESLEFFESNRDSFFPGSGNVDGFKTSIRYRQVHKAGEFHVGTAFRRADSDIGERSRIYALSIGSRFRLIKRGEIRNNVELYAQELTSLSSGTGSFQLTDNKSGTRGAIWSGSLNYGVKGGVRINFTLSGRHSNDRTARITARGEVIATF